MPIGSFTTVAGNACAHLNQIGRPVRDAEGFPGNTDRQQGGIGEDASADDVMPGAVQLEQEQLAGLQCAKEHASGRLPEIHFLDGWLGAEEREPVPVGDAYVGLHSVFFMLTSSL